MSKRVAIIGAGPAGLTAAYTLLKKDKTTDVTILEADPDYVGGISRTVKYKDFRFDIGGHRFFSKSKEVEDFWTEILPDDMLERPRSSRIFYRGAFFSYPLKAFEALFKLGVIESTLCMLSYAKARVSPVPDPKNFEDWVSNKFGKRLFSIFFKTYTEKVWGMNCKDISADWAAQRIKGLSLASAIKNALLPKKKTESRGEVIKTLIDTFRYPRLGPGMMWEACADKVREMGGGVRMGARVAGCDWNTDEKVWSINYVDASGATQAVKAEYLISSAPMRELCLSLSPKPSEAAVEAAGSLKYRDFLTVALIVRDKEQFSDNWIYIHDPAVQVGRIQNFKSWSPEMVPDAELSCYGLEYFCFKGDGLWSSSDEDLIALAKTEIEKIGLANPADVVDGCVVRQPKAYPIYDDEYAVHVETLRSELETNFPTLQMAGRNGMHKYNNQDHAMMTAMLCAENILSEKRLYDVWQVNEDADYHEEGKAGERSAVSGLRSVPTRAEVTN
ncbi:MAG TPA: NAD(P)/FAD-dependent oxidoreductase [Pyrinomonadaceae bacterium]|nr:NAD(P)/FAD-dependent oxidoreductase [Pyrinomonadaceae bacterium]